MSAHANNIRMMRRFVNVDCVDKNVEKGPMDETSDIPASERFRLLWLRAKAADSDYSMQRLAEEMGYSGASSIQRYLGDGPDRIEGFRPKLVRRILPALLGKGNPPITLEEIWELLDRDELTDAEFDRLFGTSREAHQLHQARMEVSKPKPVSIPQAASIPRDLKVLGVAVGGDDGDFSFNGEVVDYVRRPPTLEGINDAFALYIQGDSMFPRYDNGDLVMIHPGRPPVVGSDVIVELTSEHGGEAGACYIKQLVKLSTKTLTLHQFNPPQDFEIDRKTVKHVYRVLRPGEYFNV